MMKILKQLIDKLPDFAITFLVKLKICNYCRFLWLFPIQKNKIVFCNFFGNGYGDSPKYIAEKLIEKNTDCRIVWLLKKELTGKAVFPEKIKPVRYGSFRSLYELATAGVWVDNSRKAFLPPKRKGQFYIQTWHSPLRLKKIEKDACENLSSTYIERGKIDSENCDLMTAGNDFGFEIYRNSFWYNGEIVKEGTPRCDIFFKDNSKIRNKINQYFGLSPDEKLVLYAPTFRSSSDLKSCIPDFGLIINTLEKKYGGKWKMLVRFHPKTDVSFLFSDYGPFVLNASEYDDIQELLAVSEILITDYSSSMFDMLIAGKQCFLFTPDLAAYRENERGLYFEPEQLPFQVSMSTEELIRNIINSCQDEYLEKVKNFSRLVNMYEKGLASEFLVERIRKRNGLY